MALTTDVDIRTVIGDMEVRGGTYLFSGGDTTDAINTELNIVMHMTLTAYGAAIVADAPTVNETLPYDGHAITIISTANKGGRWLAYGY
jgi:hypothetical protein